MLLVTGYWLLVIRSIGYWLLVTGYWLLVTDYLGLPSSCCEFSVSNNC